MPYVLISTQIRLESGPTICGDEWSDPDLMKSLGAELVKQVGNNFSEYRTSLCPRLVLDRLEIRGYKVISTSGAGQTIIWTLHKPLEHLDHSLKKTPSANDLVGSPIYK